MKRIDDTDPDSELKDCITTLFELFHGRYGYKRNTYALNQMGYVINLKKVYRLMYRRHYTLY
ncbi:IS3 family transposase [Salinicoccus roseus]|uniref:IS3 family transposase n=1 Tax=Salinicoccus roseus TaxID=45670 RepID=UPI0035268B39